MHGIYSCRLAHNIQAQSSYKILLVVIPLGVTGLKKTKFVCFLDIFGSRGGKSVARWCGLIVCGVLYGIYFDVLAP